mmetsp:Transcript_709/g.1218  ORF Transcript_709/g.1218 Transcript_709/m.1218 type:complete len:222 (+) Transcript_709:75-740(+)
MAPNVESETPDEDVEELFAERSILYRLDSGTWTELCTGDAFLFRRQQGTVHFEMRGADSEKVVASCIIVKPRPNSPHLILEAADDQSWVWSCDQAGQEVNYALRFGSADVALDFKAAFDAAKEMSLGNRFEVHISVVAEGEASFLSAKSLAGFEVTINPADVESGTMEELTSMLAACFGADPFHLKLVRANGTELDAFDDERSISEVFDLEAKGHGLAELD